MREKNRERKRRGGKKVRRRGNSENKGRRSAYRFLREAAMGTNEELQKNEPVTPRRPWESIERGVKKQRRKGRGEKRRQKNI